MARDCSMKNTSGNLVFSKQNTFPVLFLLGMYPTKYKTKCKEGCLNYYISVKYE
jgi:hypothetical protein